MISPNHIGQLGLLASVMLVASSCGVESRRPLSDERTSRVDARLLGRWRVGEDERGVVVVSKSGESQLEVTCEGEEPPHGETNAEKFRIFTTTVGPYSLMSVPTQEKTPDAQAYLLLEYRFPDNDTLVLRALKEDKVAAAIAAKEVRGKVEAKKSSVWLSGVVPIPYSTTSVTLDESPEGLTRYIERHGAECFEETPLFTLYREK